MSPAPRLERYADDAVPFAIAGGTARLRVAATLLTNRIAAAVLNECHVPAETGATYRYVNVHNPRCPLAFDATKNAWVCAPGLEDHPAWGINWAGAQLICRHLGARLPMEHEWEAFA